MNRTNAFSYEYLTGLKTRIVGKHGKLLTICESDPDIQEAQSKGYGIVGMESDVKELEDCHRNYLLVKKRFMQNFVMEDENELIDYDEVKGKIVKKTENQLSLVDKYSLEGLDQSDKGIR